MALAPAEVLEQAAPQDLVQRDRALRPLPGGRIPGGSAPGGPKPRHLGRVLAFGVFIVVSLCMFGVVGVHALLTQDQFRLDALQHQLANVTSRHQQLAGEVAQLAAPDRIISVAEHDLGLVLPASVTYVAPTTPTTQDTSQATSTSATSAQTGPAQGTSQQAHTGSRAR